MKLNAFGRLIAETGPIVDGVVVSAVPPLRAEYSPSPGRPRRPSRSPRPLPERIRKEGARLARRRRELDRVREEVSRLEAAAKSVTAPDRAGAMLRPEVAARVDARIDAALTRYAAARRRSDVARSRVIMSESRLRSLTHTLRHREQRPTASSPPAEQLRPATKDDFVTRDRDQTYRLIETEDGGLWGYGWWDAGEFAALANRYCLEVHGFDGEYSRWDVVHRWAAVSYETNADEFAFTTRVAQNPDSQGAFLVTGILG